MKFTATRGSEWWDKHGCTLVCSPGNACNVRTYKRFVFTSPWNYAIGLWSLADSWNEIDLTEGVCCKENPFYRRALRTRVHSLERKFQIGETEQKSICLHFRTFSGLSKMKFKIAESSCNIAKIFCALGAAVSFIFVFLSDGFRLSKFLWACAWHGEASLFSHTSTCTSGRLKWQFTVHKSKFGHRRAISGEGTVSDSSSGDDWSLN